MTKISLQEIAGGALHEQFNKAFEKVVENLQNPNTPYKNTREITIKLKFTQNEKRDDVTCAVLVTEKLAPQAPTATSFAVGKDLKTGSLYAEEYGKQVRGQMGFDDVQPHTETVNGMEVDTETGEVKSKDGRVVDFRKPAVM